MGNIQISQLPQQEKADNSVVNDRWKEFLEREEGLRLAVQKRVVSVSKVISLQLTAARTSPKKYIWIRKAIATYSAAVAPLSACQKSCSACCHVPIMMLASEAKFIGREIGQTVADLPLEKRNLDAPTWQGDGNACQFMKAGTCSIYEFRPLACRLLFNMDRDALLCQHGDTPNMVPYADTSEFILATSLLAAPNDYVAELNEFFIKKDLTVNNSSS